MTPRILKCVTLFGIVATGAACAAGVAGRSGPPVECGKLRLWPTEAYLPLESGPGHLVLTTRARINNVVDGSERFCRARGRYPIDLVTLSSFTDSVAGTTCGVARLSFVDGWGHPMYFGVRAGRIEVVSAGLDGVFATPDDIGAPGEGPPATGEFGSVKDCM